MKIAKAIEILTIDNDHNPDYTDPDRRQAHQLGIEAIRRHTQQQALRAFPEMHLLPSETPEDADV